MYKLFLSIFVLMAALILNAPLTAQQEIKHPDMETIFDDQGNEIVVEVTTQRPPDARFYDVREEEGPKGPILAVYYKPTGDLVTIFLKTTIRGKAEGPGVSLFQSRVAPQIEKVIGQKSYEKDIKRRYLDLLFVDKTKFLDREKIDKKEIDEIIKRKRN
ncbi:hypothetical protein K1X84_12570 [bacterium]|nr:hypothetical protein [bacterium]